MKPEDISIQDFTYHLPEGKIALHPLEKRDASKLLVYKYGNITEDTFAHIDKYLPENCLLVFNDTKVINARISFYKKSGARIEIFCLEPFDEVQEYNTVMGKTGLVKWKCFIGGAAKWKEEQMQKNIVINNEEVVLTATKTGKSGEAYVVEFSWQPSQHSFAEILQTAGNTPLPPYIKRDAGDEDTARYQTIFAVHEGSVAAPTAGLHFTENIFKKIEQKNIISAFVTLHVGAGTFKPVKAATMEGHEMHAEYIDVHINTIKQLQSADKIAAIGTTSLRTIETLYWLGVKTFLDPGIKKLSLAQWDVYSTALYEANLSARDALEALITWMQKNVQDTIFTKTQLLIVPGYTFRMADILITNFHQPQSTLLLLVAAAIGPEWEKIYAYALENDFRFLSYGDGNLIWVNRDE